MTAETRRGDDGEVSVRCPRCGEGWITTGMFVGPETILDVESCESGACPACGYDGPVTFTYSG